MSDVDNKVKMIVEGCLLAAGRALTLDNIIAVFEKSEQPDRDELKQVMQAISEDCNDRFELKQVASGYRFQVKQDLSEWVAKLWEERPPVTPARSWKHWHLLPIASLSPGVTSKTYGVSQ